MNASEEETAVENTVDSNQKFRHAPDKERRLKNMGRYYRLTRKISDEMASEILRELREFQEVHTAELTEENQYLLLRTDEDLYSFVATKALNICRRVGNGCEISFARFAIEDLAS